MIECTPVAVIAAHSFLFLSFFSLSSFRSLLFFFFVTPCFLWSSRAPSVHLSFSHLFLVTLLLSSRLALVLCPVDQSSQHPHTSWRSSHSPPSGTNLHHLSLVDLTFEEKNGKTCLARVRTLCRYHRLRLSVETTFCLMTTTS